MVNRSVELIYDADCPNVEAARRQLQEAFRQMGQPPQWQEWERSDASSPLYAARHGSPTILVEGRDVSGGSHSGGECCRVYPNAGRGFERVPPVGAIIAALGGHPPRNGSGAQAAASLGVLPVLGAVMLPGLTCPACWPAYAGLLGSLGLPFLNYTPALAPVVVIALVAAVTPLAMGARSRGSYGLLVGGILASVLVLLGRFILQSNVVLYGGIALLILASLSNTAFKQRRSQCEENGYGR